MRRIATLLMIAMTLSCKGSHHSRLSSADDVGFTLARKVDATTKVKGLAIAVATVRDSITAHEGGMVSRADKVIHQAGLWKASWKGINDFVDQIDPANVDQAQDELDHQLRSQAALLLEAKASNRSLHEQADDLTKRLGATMRISYPLGSYGTTYGNLTATADNFITVIHDLASASDNLIQNYSAAASTISDAMRLKLRQRVLAASIANVDAALAKIDDVFLSEASLEPVAQDLTRQFLAIDDAFQNGRPFHAMELVGSMRLDCSHAMELINAAKVSAGRRAYYTKNAEATCAQAEAEYATQQSFKDADYGPLMAPYLLARTHGLRTSCQNSGTTTSVNCSLLGWVAKLDEATINQMSKAGLQQLELVVDRIESGRSLPTTP